MAHSLPPLGSARITRPASFLFLPSRPPTRSSALGRPEPTLLPSLPLSAVAHEAACFSFLSSSLRQLAALLGPDASQLSLSAQPRSGGSPISVLLSLHSLPPRQPGVRRKTSKAQQRDGTRRSSTTRGGATPFSCTSHDSKARSQMVTARPAAKGADDVVRGSSTRGHKAWRATARNGCAARSVSGRNGEAG